MISSQTQIIESQQLKSLNQSKLYSAGVDRIIDALKKQIKYEKTVKINPNNFTLRSKYQVMLNRQQDIIYRLMREIDNLQMCKEEAAMLQYDYDKMCHDYTGLLINYIQYIEERITIQKEKLLIRMSGISKYVIDNVIEESIIPKYPVSHSFISLLQSCSLRLIGDTVIPKAEIFDPLIIYLSSLSSRGDPIVLFNALQFLEILCSQNWGILGKNDLRNEHRNVIHKLLLIIPHAFMYLKSIWDEIQSHVVPIFIIQIFQTLNPLLNILNIMNSEYSTIYATNHHIIADKSLRKNDRNLPGDDDADEDGDEDDCDDEASYNDSVHKDDDNSSYTSRSDKIHRNKYYCFGENYSFELLIEDIILWLKLFKIAKLQLLHQPTLSLEIIQVVNKILKVYNEHEISIQVVHNMLKSNSHLRVVIDENNKNLNYDDDDNNDGNDNNYDGNKSGHHTRSSSKQILHLFNRKSDVKFNKKLKVIKRVCHEISKLLVLGSSLTTNILQCVEKLIYFLTNDSIDDNDISKSDNTIPKNDNNTLPMIDSIPYFGSMAHTLLLYSLDLGIINCSKFAMILGGQENPVGACINDYKFLKSVDNEVAIIIQLATISFSFGLWEILAYDVVRNASSIIMHRSSNMVLSSAWIHCLIACSLCCLEIEPPEPHITYDALRHYFTIATSPTLDTKEANDNNTSTSNQQHRNMSTNNNLSHHMNRLNAMKSASTTYNDNDHKKNKNKNKNNDNRAKATISMKVFEEKKCNDRLFLIPFMSTFIDKVSVIYHLHSMAIRILGVTYSLKHLLPIVHSGLLLLRLLLREPFMKRMEAENLFDISLTHILQPLVSEVNVKRVSDDDDDNNHNNNNDEKASSKSNKLPQSSQIVDVTMSTYLSEADPTDVTAFHNHSSVDDDANRLGTPEPSVDSVSFSKSSSRGASSKGNPQSVDTYWTKWHAEHYIQAFQGTSSSSSGDKKAGDISASDTNLKTLLTFLVYIGESHLQSTEVIEQLLLFIEQMLSKSPVLRHAMDDTGIPMVIQRIIDSQQNNIYMVALAELCLDVFK